jgi:hypothetical protein
MAGEEEEMKKKLKPRNPIALIVRKLRPKVVPDKRRKLLERAHARLPCDS